MIPPRSVATKYAGTAQVEAGSGSQVAVRVHQRAGIVVHDGRFARIVERAGVEAKLGFPVHHTCCAYLRLCTGQQGPRYTLGRCAEVNPMLR